MMNTMHNPLQNRTTRRQMLRLTAGAAWAMGLWPGWLPANDSPDAADFRFLAVNDIHLVDKGCAAWLQKAVAQMKAEGKPAPLDFCLLIGDLGENGSAEQIATVRDVFKDLGVTTYTVIGNHDYLTQDDRKAYEQLVPDSLNYTFEHRGWQFVGLDTTQGLMGKDTSIPADTLRWVDDTLPKLDRKRPMVLFTHFPLGGWLPCRPKNADALLDRFKEFNLRHVFNGHFHSLTERSLKTFTLTTNKCCSYAHPNHDGTPEKGYFVCSTANGDVHRLFRQVQQPDKQGELKSKERPRPN